MVLFYISGSQRQRRGSRTVCRIQHQTLVARSKWYADGIFLTAWPIRFFIRFEAVQRALLLAQFPLAGDQGEPLLPNETY